MSCCPSMRLRFAPLFALSLMCALPLYAAEPPASLSSSDTTNAPNAPVPPADATHNDTPAVAISASPEMELGEVRALWVVRDSLTSPQKIRNAVALAKKYGFNTLFVQVRGRGDAFYDSRFEPRSEELMGQPLEFDPLAVAVEEGHKAGLEVHAWVNTFLVWHKSRRPHSRLHVINQHTDWLVRDKQGKAHLTPVNDCEGAFLDPAIPGVREHTKNVFLDIASRYDVDGLHFDYVRYPSERFSFSPAAINGFREYMGGLISENDRAFAERKFAKNRLAYTYLYPREWKEWRKAQVTQVVREISEEAHRLKPNLIISAAVFPNYSVAANDKGQAWREWLRDDLLDAACPMAYNRSTPLVGSQIRDAVAHSHGKPIIAGVGAWQMPAASAIAKGQVCRDLGAGGLNFFSYDGMTRNGRTEAYLSKVRTALFSSRTAPPNWRRKKLVVPPAGGAASPVSEETVR